MIRIKSLFQLLFSFNLILSITSGAYPGQDNNNNNGTYLKSTIAALNNTPESTITAEMSTDLIQNITVTPMTSQNSTRDNIDTTVSPNSTQDSSVFTESTAQSGTKTTTPSTQMTTDIKSSTNATSVSTVTDSAPTAPESTTQGDQATVNATGTSDALSHKSQTTEPSNGTEVTTYVTSPAYTNTLGAPNGFSYSEKTMTIFFSVFLGVAVLVIVMFMLNRCKRRKTQYSHRPLYNNSEETVDRFVAADDTLVISGGLYDGPRIYNPTMTTMNDDEDFHSDQPSFVSRPTQFRLEFLSEEQEKCSSYGTATFETFQPEDDGA